jgi:5-methylcytosine-specific restriction endonuclease McrBC GTP-binding regulatory subunit McrB
MKADKLDIQDIKGTQSTTNNKQKQFQVRDHINVNDIVEEARIFKPQQVINKNDGLLTDDVLGRKKVFNKNSSPLDPKYIVSTKSKRMMVLGDIDGGKPKQFVKKDLRKDTKRYMRVDDIQGASPRENIVIPESLLPELHPMFQDRQEVPREMKEIGNAIKLKDRASYLMGEVLKRNLSVEDTASAASPTKAGSKYKQIHERWL